MDERILFVDDEQNILDSMRRQLGRKYKIVTANGGKEALFLFENEGPFPLVISDMQMPEINGLELLKQIKAKSKDTVCMMLTGNADQRTAVDAINEGRIFRFFTKPCKADALEDGIQEAFKYYELLTLERDLLERTLAGSVKLLVDILAIFDPAAFSFTRQMRTKARYIAMSDKLKFGWDLDMAIMLSPLGRMMLPIEISTKIKNARRLTHDEDQLVARAPETAHRLLSGIPRLEKVAKQILYQEKGFDGSGYPEDDVKGKDIPFGSRLIKILNDLEAAKKKTDSIESAIALLKMNDHLYDPGLLRSLEQTECMPPPVSPTETVKVNVSSVRVGDKLLTSVRAEDGTLILSAGLDLTEVDIERLHNKARLYDNIKEFTVSREKGKVY